MSAFNEADLAGTFNGKPLSQEIPLGLDGKERIHLLEVAVAGAVKRGYDDKYNAATRNCNVMVFEALGELAFPPDRKVHSMKVGFRTRCLTPVIGPATNRFGRA